MDKREEIRGILNAGLKEIGIFAHFKEDPASFMESVEATLAALVILERDRLRKRSEPVPEVFGTA